MKAQLSKNHYSAFPQLNLALPASERRMLLFAGDLMALFLASLAAAWSNGVLHTTTLLGTTPQSSDALWLFCLAIIWITAAGVNECYEPQIASHRLPSMLRILIASLVTAFFYLLAFFVLSRPFAFMNVVVDTSNTTVPPRVLVLLFLMTTFMLNALWRIGYIQLFAGSSLRRRLMIVGAGRSGSSFVRALKKVAHNYEIVGFIDDDPAKQGQWVEGLPILGSRSTLVGQVRACAIDEIIVAITHDMHTELLQAVMDCYEQEITIKPMAMVYEELLGQVPVDHLGHKWLPVPFWSSAVLPTFYRAFKRLLDLALALIGLACAAPFLPLIALAIYLDCPGPIFYVQERLGRGGKPFRVIKFRSMVPNAERGGQAVWATRNDQRITRIGKFIRRTRIDELPQLLNVLKGEMSFVGPRPERAQFVDQLQQQIPFYRARLSIKPGLTGWAQINYGYGSTVEDAQIKLQYDLYYSKHRSITLDLLIIFRTIMVVLAFKGT